MYCANEFPYASPLEGAGYKDESKKPKSEGLSSLFKTFFFRSTECNWTAETCDLVSKKGNFLEVKALAEGYGLL